MFKINEEPTISSKAQEKKSKISSKIPLKSFNHAVTKKVVQNTKLFSMPHILNASEEKDSDIMQLVKSDEIMTKTYEGKAFFKMNEQKDEKTGNIVVTFCHPDFNIDGDLAGLDHQIRYIYKGKVLIGIEAGKNVECENPLVSLTDEKGKILSQQADTYFERGEFKIRRTQAMHNIVHGKEREFELGRLSIAVNGKKEIDVREHLKSRNIKDISLMIMGMAAEEGSQRRATVKLVEPHAADQ